MLKKEPSREGSWDGFSIDVGPILRVLGNAKMWFSLGENTFFDISEAS